MIDLTLHIKKFMDVVKILSAPKKEYTLKSLSLEMQLSISDLREIIDIGLRNQEIYRIKLNGIDWSIAREDLLQDTSSNNNESSRLFSGFYDNYTLSLSSKNRTFLADKRTYNHLCNETAILDHDSSESILNDSIFVFKSNHSKKAIRLSDEYNPLISLVDKNLQKRIKTPCLLPDDKIIFPLGIYYSDSGDFYAIARKPEDKQTVSFFPFSSLKSLTDTAEILNKNLNRYQIPALNIDEKNEINESEYNHIKDLKRQIWTPRDVGWNETPIEYRILVMNEDNTKAKILRDLSHIYLNEKTENKEGLLFLRFTLLDSPEFFQWILSYGSSIVVLSPSDFRKNVLQEYLNILIKTTKTDI